MSGRNTNIYCCPSLIYFRDCDSNNESLVEHVVGVVRAFIMFLKLSKYNAYALYSFMFSPGWTNSQ